ncbi:MAG: TonB-dependent receptor, partial [Paucibacter sp.]|nr:TonB-dependent receptor [Roseateles sp.]
ANGTINPFGQQTAAGQQALDNASVTGTLLEAKGQVYQWDGHASRELGDWFGAGHPAQIAVGAELRHEAFFDRVPANEIAFANQVVASTGVDPATNNSGSRNVYALFTELNAPLTKHLELTAALRSDKYSDFGSSINPKISLRFQPAKDLLLRGSFTTGFRAPSLYELNAPQTYTNTANSYNDPVNCPGGVALAGQNPNNVCGTQFIALTGGNSHLKAETSKGLTLGFVSSPNDALNFGLDFWWIRMQHEIGALSQDDIFANPFKYASLFQRAPNGTLSISALTCPGLNCGYVVDTNDNLGGVNVNGVDLNLSYRLRTTRAGTFNLAFAGTYVTQYALQLEENGPWFQNDGIYFNGNPVFRWQHNLSLSWNRDAWSAGVVNHFKSSYTDQNNVAAPYNHNQVGCYSTWDLFGNWTATPALSLTAGVRNLFDQNPPFSNQSANFQVGYDPRYTDPAGRTFYLRGNYSF